MKISAAFLAAALLAPGLAQAQGQVTVYCSILEEQCRVGTAAFERETGIKVAMVRKSTGEAFAQVKAEATNPRADVWWGGPADSHLQAAEEGLLEPYDSPRLAELHDWALKLHATSGRRVSGIYLGALGLGFNTKVLASRGIAEPRCWADLLDQKFADEVQMADPNSSGTAYVMLASIVQLMGEDKGFEYLRKLHKNINQYTKSGAAPVKAVALGETAVGIAFMHDMITMVLQGSPMRTVAPCEGTGYETGAVSMVKGAKNPDAAKRFMDFALSAEAQKRIGAGLKINWIAANKGAPTAPEAPKLSEIKLIDYDSAKYGSSAERTRLLRKWDAEVKAAPK